MVLVEEMQTISVLIGSLQKRCKCNSLGSIREDAAVLIGFSRGNAYPYCSWWLYSRGEAALFSLALGEGMQALTVLTGSSRGDEEEET